MPPYSGFEYAGRGSRENSRSIVPKRGSTTVKLKAGPVPVLRIDMEIVSLDRGGTTL